MKWTLLTTSALAALATAAPVLPPPDESTRPIHIPGNTPAPRDERQAPPPSPLNNTTIPPMHGTHRPCCPRVDLKCRQTHPNFRICPRLPLWHKPETLLHGERVTMSKSCNRDNTPALPTPPLNNITILPPIHGPHRPCCHTRDAKCRQTHPNFWICPRHRSGNHSKDVQLDERATTSGYYNSDGSPCCLADDVGCAGSLDWRHGGSVLSLCDWDKASESSPGAAKETEKLVDPSSDESEDLHAAEVVEKRESGKKHYDSDGRPCCPRGSAGCMTGWESRYGYDHQKRYWDNIDREISIVIGGPAAPGSTLPEVVPTIDLSEGAVSSDLDGTEYDELEKRDTGRKYHDSKGRR